MNGPKNSPAPFTAPEGSRKIVSPQGDDLFFKLGSQRALEYGVLVYLLGRLIDRGASAASSRLEDGARKIFVGTALSTTNCADWATSFNHRRFATMIACNLYAFLLGLGQ